MMRVLEVILIGGLTFCVIHLSCLTCLMIWFLAICFK